MQNELCSLLENKLLTYQNAIYVIFVIFLNVNFSDSILSLERIKCKVIGDKID